MSTSWNSLCGKMLVRGRCLVRVRHGMVVAILFSMCASSYSCAADLLLADPGLRELFAPYFTGEEQLNSGLLTRLTNYLQHSSKLAIGVIMDEVQKITANVRDKGSDSYFTSTWFNWGGRLSRYTARMDIASSHGACGGAQYGLRREAHTRTDVLASSAPRRHA